VGIQVGTGIFEEARTPILHLFVSMFLEIKGGPTSLGSKPKEGPGVKGVSERPT
jgi:hypothetical protein